VADRSIVRCSWATSDELYIKYHDEEWGVPVGLGSRTAKTSARTAQSLKANFSSVDVPSGTPFSDKNAYKPTGSVHEPGLSAQETSHADRTHFEFLVLEGAQAGLSWITILKRRQGYRRAFANFDPKVVANFSDNKLEELRQDTGIIRNKLKIKSARTNARVFLDIQKQYGSFNTYIWAFVGGEQKVNEWQSDDEVPATSIESDYLSKDLKKRGMSFVGSTIMYAHMQACGLVFDHTASCFKYKQLQNEKKMVKI